MSKKVLVVTATPLSPVASRSKAVTEAFLEAYQAKNPNDEIIRRDLFGMEMPYIDGDMLNGWGKYASGEAPTEKEADLVAAFAALTDEFLAADRLIIQSPMWNLSIPAQLKGYLDALMVAGKTFAYTEAGPRGLVQGKKAIHIHGAGGTYSNTTGIEHSDAFVTGILKFIGLDVAPTIWVEGIDSNPDAKEAIMSAALVKAKEAAEQF